MACPYNEMQNSYFWPLEHLPQLEYTTPDLALQTIFSSHHPSKCQPFTLSNSHLQCSLMWAWIEGVSFLIPRTTWLPSWLSVSVPPTLPILSTGLLTKASFRLLPFLSLPSQPGISIAYILASASIILLNWLFLWSSHLFSGIFLLDLFDVYRTSLLYPLFLRF